MDLKGFSNENSKTSYEQLKCPLSEFALDTRALCYSSALRGGMTPGAQPCVVARSSERGVTRHLSAEAVP
jgi:hypothetical protein